MEMHADNLFVSMVGDLDYNSTGNDTLPKWSRDETLANVEIAVLAVILIIAVIGNGLMLLALLRKIVVRPMSRIYYFMMHLSMADLLVAFGNILPQLIWDITFRFYGPDFLCRFVKFLQVFVLYLSTYILTSMTLDRYMVVCRQSFSSSHNPGNNKGPKILIALSYILAFILALPQAFIFSIQEIETGVTDCWVTFIEPWGARAYVTWFVTVTFILPLVIIGGSYGAICWKVIRFRLPGDDEDTESKSKFIRFLRKSHSETTSTDDNKSKQQQNSKLKRQLSQAKMKTLKLTLVVVLCFFICWCPFCVTQLIMVYSPPEHGHDISPIKVVFLLLASLNSCTNPWIYMAFSDSLMNQIRVWLGLGLKRSSDDNDSIGDEHHQGRGIENPNTKGPKKRDFDERIRDKAKDNRRNDYGPEERIGFGLHDGQASGPFDQGQPETKSDVV